MVGAENIRMTDNNNVSLKPARIAWSALIWAIVLLFLAVQAAQLTLYLARWPVPIRYSSIVTLFAMAWFIWKGSKKFIQWAFSLTLKRIVIGIMIMFAIIVFLVGMNNPSKHGPLMSFRDAALTISRRAAQITTAGFDEIIRFPSQMWTAYTDHSISDGEMGDLKEEEIISVNDENISPIEIPASLLSQSLEAELGDQVLTSSQAASLCKMTALANGPFQQGERVTLIEGPRFLEDEWWWRVQAKIAVGWCPSTALSKIKGDF